MVCPVALRSRGVQSLICGAVIGLLKENVGAYAGILQLAVVLHRGGGDVHIHAAYRSVLMAYGVDGLDRLQYIFDGALLGVLARFQGQSLVSHILQGNHFATYLLLCQSAARDMLVLRMIRTVYATVHTVVREVVWGKHHDAVAIDAFLQSAGDSIHALLYLLVANLDEHSSLTVRDAFAQFGLGEYLLYQRLVITMLTGIFQRGAYLTIVDKLLGTFRLSIICYITVLHPLSPNVVFFIYR